MQAALTKEAGIANLQGSVEEALWDYEPVRTARHPLEVRAHPDGRVEVSGPVRTRLIRDTVIELIGNHPNVREVVASIYADPDVEVAVARKLAEDPRTLSIPPGAVQVHSHYGRLTLVGRLPQGVSPEQVLEVASQVEGVRRVVDRLIPGGG